MSITARIRTVSRLSRFDRAVVMRAALALPTVAVALRLTSLARVQSFLSDRFRPRSPELGRSGTVTRLVSDVIEHHPYRANCLERSLTLWWLLGREGISSDIVFGVRPPTNGATPDFHAWVEIDGDPLIDRLDIAKEFIPFDRPIGRDLGRFV